MLIFSDLHLRAESMTVCRQVLSTVLQVAVQRDAGTVAFLGDFYHLRYQVPVLVQNLVVEWLEDVQGMGLNLILLPGNHDQVDELGANALEVFAGFDGVQVYSESIVDKWGAWVPYRKPEFVPAILEQLKAPDRTLFAHLPIKGALMNNLKACEAGVTTDVLGGWRRVWTGHYHKPQDLELPGGTTAHYVGSPYQTRADEFGQQKFFVLWNGDEYERVKVNIGPKFHRLDISDLKGAQVLWGAQDTVRLTVPEVTPELQQWAQKVQGNVLLEDQSQKEVQPRFAFDEGTSLSEYAAQYMADKAPKGLDQNALWAMWSEMQ